MSDEPKSRGLELLDAAATALLDGRDPFSREFLVEHRVTADECGDLGEQFAIFAMAFLRGSPDFRGMVVALGATHDMEIDPVVLEAQIRYGNAKRAMNALGGGPRWSR